MRRMFVVLGLLLATAGWAMPAWSGDAARLNVIGFSDDRRYFAFEQFGEQDGSGFVYSDIFITDLEQNAWVKGSPIHVQAESEDTGSAAIRQQARLRADKILKTLHLDRPAEIIASNPVTEVVENRKSMVFDRFYRGFGGQPQPFGVADENRYELLISDVSLPGKADCYTEDNKLNGFSLSVRKTTTGVVTPQYKDESVPASRICPTDYEIDTVASYRDDHDNAVYVALVAYYAQGFEGLNRRFVAVPFNPE